MDVYLENLKKINGLSLPDFMDGNQLRNYQNELDDFINRLPDLSNELLKVFVSGDMYLLNRKLENLAAVLKNLYANQALAKCSQLIELLKTDKEKDELDIILGKFVVELTTLSIDIQLAQYKQSDNIQTNNIQTRSRISEDSDSDRKHILAIDDTSIMLNTLKAMIDGEKYKFSGITSGKAALLYLDTHNPPDLIILDINMPVMDGHELASYIKTKGHKIPIVYLTSSATKENIKKAVQLGASDFLVKPVNKELVLDRIERCLSDYQNSSS